MSDVGRHNNSSSSYYQNLRLSHGIDVDLCTGQDTTPNSMKSTQERLQDTTNRAANSAGRGSGSGSSKANTQSAADRVGNVASKAGEKARNAMGPK
ncbi:hypothetical protein MMC32_008026 [Xylographa parallela]|nr:hypothetical protein [Xylographa parallela]